MEPFKIIRYPISTEKTIHLMESENKMVFIVDKKAGKEEIKKAIEAAYNAKVTKVNTLIDHTGKKRAYIKFSSKTPAVEIATQLGLM